jgi:hypothetical protein
VLGKQGDRANVADFCNNACLPGRSGAMAGQNADLTIHPPNLAPVSVR